MNFEIIQHEQTPATPEIENISEFLETNKSLIAEFEKFAKGIDRCLGLAANQCSLEGNRLNLRMAAIKDVKSNDFFVAIYPKIVKYYGIKRQREEGCLTWKQNNNGVWRIIADRYHFIDVEYYLSDGSFHKETFKGFQAQIWQHEVNHLEGVGEFVTNNYQELEVPIDLKTERNAPCPCGSGLKYKKCCIEN